MSRRLSGFLRNSKMSMLVMIVILCTGAGTLLAQAQVSVPSLLDQIIDRLINLQNGVDALQTSVDSQDQVTTRFTPMYTQPFLGETPIVVGCTVVNVANTPRTIQARLMNNSTQVSSNASPQGQFVPLNPGTTSSFFVSFSGSGHFYCKFAVVDAGATKADFRGGLEYSSSLNNGVALPAE